MIALAERIVYIGSVREKRWREELASRKRRWTDITADILEMTLTPAGKTRIMYKTNLNFERFSSYFQDLLRKGLIMEMDDAKGRRVYKATERGKTLLEVLKKAHDIFSQEKDL